MAFDARVTTDQFLRGIILDLATISEGTQIVIVNGNPNSDGPYDITSPVGTFVRYDSITGVLTYGPPHGANGPVRTTTLGKDRFVADGDLFLAWLDKRRIC